MENMLSLNFTNSSPASYPEEKYYDRIFRWRQLLIITLLSITFVLGTVGNGLVIWIAGFRMKKTVNTIWFLNLGIADISFCLLLPLYILDLAMGGRWPLGQIMCKVLFTSIFLNMSVSIFFLMTISVDRCTSVLCPVWSKNHRSVKLARNISVIIWLLCLTLSSPYLAFYDTAHDPDSNSTYCIVTYATFDNATFFDYQTWYLRHKTMFVTRFISMFLIPFIIIIICYGLVAFWIRKNSKHLGSSRTFRIIVTIILCFFGCWFLYHLWPLFDFTKVHMNWLFDLIMYDIGHCLAYFNCCLNPIIYVFVGRDFKRSLRKSIPFLLENTFRERVDPLETHNDTTTVGTELLTYHT
ncbi:formyl peptide receptor-related sequence 4 [Xenopus laevis]|uniref:Formyl peptide receptor-related sequence 4 n=2 Tax=Xenopus laevis TaxID=8355 RepID=A0A1L8FNY5_XENLA|nr:formyl peptide receptor-related sequence 4 [Xenopus laevis]OCT73297.1 hypothetical protein XELAEV_18036278mg [Xenopus laevis]